MIELTDAKCDKIAAAAIARDYVTPPRGTPFDIAVIYRILVRAGLAVGIERAAAALDSTNPQLRPSGCAIVIRALNATQPKEK